MKKAVWSLILFCFLFLPQNVKAKNIQIYLFHGDGCPHCREEIEYLNELKKSDPSIEMTLYETWYHPENQILKEQVQETLGSTTTGVPLTVIGERYFSGFSENTKTDITRAITYYRENQQEYKDVVTDVLNHGPKVKKPIETDVTQSEDMLYEVPVLGEINGKEIDAVTLGALFGMITAGHPDILAIMLLLSFFFAFIKEEELKWREVAISTVTLIGIYFLTLCTFHEADLSNFLLQYQRWVPYLLSMTALVLCCYRKKAFWVRSMNQNHKMTHMIVISISMIGLIYLVGTKTEYIDTFFTIQKIQELSIWTVLFQYGVFSIAFGLGILLIQSSLMFLHMMFKRKQGLQILFTVCIFMLMILTITMPSLWPTYF